MIDEFNNILVSISCITYNHAPYIRQCLEGLLMQKTNFAFEVLIHDDCSTDGTTEIIKEYEVKYPNIIKPLYEEENQYVKGRRGSRTFNFPRAKGKYIALCEGDDYWIDPLKLQKQVDFLEANPEYVLSHTNFRYYFEFDKKYFENKHCASNLEILSKGLIPEDILHRYFVQTLTVVIRKDAYQKAIQHDEFLFSGYFLMGDTQLWYELSKLGKIHFLADVTGVYRKNEGSATRGNVKSSYRFELSSAELRQYLCMKDNLSPDFSKKTQVRYNRAMYKYRELDPYFTPIFCITKKGTVLLSLLKKIFILKPLLEGLVIYREYLGYIKRLLRI